jgi:hypothetical protein
VLNRDFGRAALLGELVAVTGHVAVLPGAREACTTFGQGSTRLALGTRVLSIAAEAALLIVGAERAVAANRGRSIAVPRREATKTAWAAAEARATEVHASKAINQGCITAVAKARGHKSRSSRLVVPAVLLKTARVVSKGRREAGCWWDRRRSVRAKVCKGLRSAKVVAARSKLVGVILVSTKVARTLVTKATAVVKVVVLGTHITEVSGGSAVESAPLFILKRSDLRHGWADTAGASGLLEDVNSALVSLALGWVTKTHVVGKSVHNAALRWWQGSREDDQIATGILLEQE